MMQFKTSTNTESFNKDETKKSRFTTIVKCLEAIIMLYRQ